MAPLHFLLLEDNAFDAELVSTTLENSDLDCIFTMVETQAAFESVLSAHPIDLVFADYSLPTFDGLRAIELVVQKYPYIPCILISAVLGEDRAIEALKSGAADYVLKQRLERLVPATKRALREFKERRVLANTAAQLKESEERFRTSVETMADPLAILSATRHSNGWIEDFTVDYFNRAACEYLSISLEQQNGQSLYSLIPGLQQPGNHRLFDAFCDVVDTGRPTFKEVVIKGMTVKGLSDTKTAQLQQVVLEMRVSKLNDGLVMTWHDITRRRRTEQQRAELLAEADNARAQAERANRFKDVFLAHLSHELRSPLSAIKGWLQVIPLESHKPEVLPKALESIGRNADSLELLIGDLLENARIEQGQFSFDPQPIKLQDLAALIEASIQALMPIAQSAGITVELLTANFDNSFYIIGDLARLEQVIRNLLSNAIKFTPKDGRITLSLSEQEQDTINLTVKDTGKGMSADTINHIFERFWQSSATSSNNNKLSTIKSKGLGLGLSIVHHIVEIHQGKITVASDGEDLGSTFSVTLPRHRASPTSTLNPPAAITPSIEAPLSETSLAGRRILIVEDHADALETYVLMLTSYGASVEGVRSASEALDAFQKYSPDLLISDLQLPDESGYSLIRKIRTLPQRGAKEIPAVALSAYTEDTYCARALLAGFQMHVAKPIELKDMVSLASRLCQ